MEIIWEIEQHRFAIYFDIGINAHDGGGHGVLSVGRGQIQIERR